MPDRKISPRRNYYSLWYSKNREKSLANTKKWQEEHKEQYKIDIKRRNAEIKLQVIEHYSNGTIKCLCCEESNIKFLTIDHLGERGIGTEHRKKLKDYNIYYWLKKNGFPEGYQVLCYNCNCGRDKNGGICPHKEI